MPVDTPDNHDASTPENGRRLTRRQVIGAGAGAAGVAVLAAYGLGRDSGEPAKATTDVVLKAEPGTIDLGARTAKTWVYNGALAGPVLRLKEGQRFRARVENGLPQPTSVHWHGIRLPNAMDGVPGVTQKAIEPGDSFVYDFIAPDAGTYMYHSHLGTQLDRGLYGALIVEARQEPLSYDREAVLVLDDWLDGISGTPDSQLETLRKNGMQMDSGMDMGSGMEMDNGVQMGATGNDQSDAMSGMAMGSGMSGKAKHTTLGGRVPAADSLAGLANAMEKGSVDSGDVAYPLYLINGRPPLDPESVRVRGGERLRLRIANPAADTLFCVFVEGHELEVTHADGLPIKPVRTDGIVVGMGERYDVVIDAKNPGRHRIIAVPLGKTGRAVATLRYLDAPSSKVAAPDAPLRMPKRVISYSDMVAADEPSQQSGGRDTPLELAMGAGRYEWTIGGQKYPDADPLRFDRGETVRLAMRNTSEMPHPMHLHGHFFREVRARGLGPSKDTIIVPPKARTTVEFVADNPGRWAFHCHNVYHAEAGMMRIVEVPGR